MAVGETPVTLVGTVLSELSTRKVGDSGHHVVSFWVRSNERRRDRETDEWVDGRQLTVRVTCWRRLAETVGESLVKGDPVIASGKLYTRDYQQDGQNRSLVELEAYAIGPNLSRCDVVVRRRGRPEQPVPLWEEAGEGEVSRALSPGEGMSAA
ncbi:single-stranded DNA-binding protein [Amycolatopsis sp. 195334CR]|uniref:single-stranded DNA-binding protein n=1 Tax=Amycolatopsis sp. 195334CR TaxID=2814588 RepID=UPI001A90BAF7|nr:single-stranded DNA-binding protein [Amycolatopsis sp. 195334CR]MBN6037322.1 single-stranded DNA-binding protein [Amycolatopsis sp. 195334CR]